MKSLQPNYKRLNSILFLILTFSLWSGLKVNANNPLRRPISPQQPMYLVHIDTWNYADPQKIIDLIPKDIRPYVVMNISLSISHNVSTSQFQVAEYGYEIAKSWLRTCAQNQMWAVVQHSSGGYAQFSDFDLSVYNEFFRDFPNLIGINYAEQFWGFDDTADPLSPKWTDRINHFANLLKLCNQYGGYLIVSWCGNEWSPSINPIGMLKRNPAFVAACEKYTQNYLLFEKYTQQAYQSDMESICLGAYLSGYSGNYGIRYDDTGWTDSTGTNKSFTMATAGAVHLEHMMLTGSTMIDGPELIWTQCFRETARKSTTDGYMMRDWETFPQFINVSVDLFRKVLDGTVRIPTRQEVIDRTKYVIINDVNSGTNDAIYSSPETLFEGLYRMDGDGNLRLNKTFFKKTGRYPTIPTVYKLNGTMANSFQYKINKSAYSGRWPTTNSKVVEFNSQFPAEYTGNIYAGRHENGWVIYNPFKTVQIASGTIPFKYNTCDSVFVSFSQYTASVMKEYTDKLTFYLSNYDNVLNTGLKTDIIKIYGSTVEPTFSYTERGNHQASNITSNWTDGVYTLTVRHNGPLDITINCSGTATSRLTAYTPSTMVEPVKPPLYTGPRQYEAECFDYKSISGITTAGQGGSIRNYTGQGYLQMGLNSFASVRDTVYALRAGKYQLITKYMASSGDVTHLDLYVNGVNVATPVFTKTANLSTWNYNTQKIDLNAGKNLIVFKANRTGTYSIYLDNIVITQGTDNGIYHFENDSVATQAKTPPANLISSLSGTAGVISYIDGNSKVTNAFKTYSVGTLNGTGVVNLDMFPNLATDYSVVWKEFCNTSGAKKGMLLRGTGNAGSCLYAEGLKQGYLFIVTNNVDNTITLNTYLAEQAGLTGKTTHTSVFTVQPGMPYWLRATAVGNNIKFECSADSITWEGGINTLYIDGTYQMGSTQIVWGLNSDNYNWAIDNIAFIQGHISVSKAKITDLDYIQGSGPSVEKTFKVTSSCLISDIEIQATGNFEISLTPAGGYAQTLSIAPINSGIQVSDIYVRMKSGLPIGSFEGKITLRSDLIVGDTIILNGKVTPVSVGRVYNFTNDIATVIAQNPPALFTSVGKGSTATAGVVSFTDSRLYNSNMFRAYSGGQRNSTGAINLERFSKTSTDYSVTWKQCVGSGTADYKVGMLLRGDTSKVGNTTTGYVQGMMHGYLFLAYTANGGTTKHSEFRIYRSTEALNTLNMLVNSSVNTLIPTAGQPVWYKATVSGISPVTLKIEYSTDSVTWNIGATVTDNGATVFTKGATQIIWGLGAANFNFYLDDISYYGIESPLGIHPDAISISVNTLSGFSYIEQKGPSASQSFTVFADSLSEKLYIDAPANYELSMSAVTGYTSTIVLNPINGSIQSTTIYVRLKSGLIAKTYSGNISVSSVRAATKTISLSGTVESDPNGIPLVSNKTARVISKEYFLLTGQKVQNRPLVDGVYIVRYTMSDKTIVIKKERYLIQMDK